MLSLPLSDQQSLEDFIKDKSDREVSVAALTIIDQHVKECSERSERVAVILKWIARAIVLLLVETITTDAHWTFFKHAVSIVFGG